MTSRLSERPRRIPSSSPMIWSTSSDEKLAEARKNGASGPITIGVHPFFAAYLRKGLPNRLTRLRIKHMVKIVLDESAAQPLDGFGFFLPESDAGRVDREPASSPTQEDSQLEIEQPAKAPQQKRSGGHGSKGSRSNSRGGRSGGGRGSNRGRGGRSGSGSKRSNKSSGGSGSSRASGNKQKGNSRPSQNKPRNKNVQQRPKERSRWKQPQWRARRLTRKIKGSV